MSENTSEVIDFTPLEETLVSVDQTPKANLDESVVTLAELSQLCVVPRCLILEPFFKEGDYGIVYARRGDGKTWLAMLMAAAIARGGNAGPWKTLSPTPVLYIDGEMPLEETKRRSIQLQKLVNGEDVNNLHILHHEFHFDNQGHPLNLTDLTIQQEISGIIKKRGIKVVFLDNLSCLFTGLKENDADSWELVLPWLLELRRERIAVVLIAHAGRNKEIRGTSRREDHAFWCLNLEKVDQNDDALKGIRFNTFFKKNRNALDNDSPPLEWTLETKEDDSLNLSIKGIGNSDALLGWIRDGLETATEIATEMNLSVGQVSKLAKKAEQAGFLKIENRRYKLKDKQA
jgi:hypothetical protein